MKTRGIDEVQRAGCAAHGLASGTLVSKDLLPLDVVALLAAECQQVSIVGELPANDHFVEAVVDGRAPKFDSTTAPSFSSSAVEW